MIVNIRPDPFDKKTWYTKEVPDLCAYLAQEFDVFPSNARIYHGMVTFKNDVTPIDERGINNLQSLDGEFYVVVYPKEPISAALWALYAVIAATTAYSLYMVLTMPKPVISAAQSSNNDLASRQNQARLGGRVPEVFGKLRAVPDLISAPMTYYDDNNKEIEECLMLCTRGYVQIHDVKDDQTSINDIADMAVSVYDPFTSIIGAPIYQVGEAFTEPPSFSIKSKSINGQTLNVPNDQKIESSEIYFQFPDLIKTASPFINLDTLFDEDDSIAIYGAEFIVDNALFSGALTVKATKQIVINSAQDILSVNNFQSIILSAALVKVITTIPPAPPATDPTIIENYYDLSGNYSVSSTVKTPILGGFEYLITLHNAEQINQNWQYIEEDYDINAGVIFTNNTSSINLNGTYIVDSVSANEIKLINPDLLNSDWSKLNTLANQNTQSQPRSIRLDKLNNSWVGWHNLDLENTEELVFNLFYQNGLFYQDSKGGVWGDTMTVLVEYQYINASNQPIGTIYSELFSVSNSSKSPFGTTRKIILPVAGKVRFRIARTTPTKNDKTQDLTKIKDVYAVSKSTVLNYGDVTIIRSKTIGTEGALSLKERKLNMLVTRKLPLNGTGALTPTTSAAQALIYLAFDSKNGRRSSFEVDVDQILATEQEVNAYFGSAKASEFSYTLDDNNLSFEEIAGMVASSCFCEPTRFGSKLRLNFEQPKEIPTLLFNHRNKVPKSEKRTQSFGVSKDYDGVQIEYTSPNDDARINYTAPETGTRNNLLKISTTGIRTEEQAKTRAWREWNKLYYQRVTCEFEGLDESNLLSRNDLILVANNTKLTTQDGDVESVDGLTLSLSQNVIIETGSSIYLQMSDGTVDIIGCVEGSAKNQVILSRAPLMPLVVDNDRYAKTTYEIINAGNEASSMFLLAEMSPQSKMTNSLKCVNYDARYYEKDHEFF